MITTFETIVSNPTDSDEIPLDQKALLVLLGDYRFIFPRMTKKRNTVKSLRKLGIAYQEDMRETRKHFFT